jgi:NAD(P)H-nitrite reductase large subunit
MGRRAGHPVIVCRCNDVTLEDVEKAIESGCTDLECLRRLLRIGFGPCQGRTCIPQLVRILARKTGRKPSEIMLPTSRPPIVPLRASMFVDECGGESG